MNRSGKIVMIIILSILLWVLIGGFCWLLYSQHTGNFWNTKSVVQKEEILEATDFDELTFSFRSGDVSVKTTDDSQIRIVQYDYRKLKEKHLFTTEQYNRSLTVAGGNVHFGIGFLQFGFFSSRYEIYIPKSFKGDVKIITTSGNIKIENSLDFETVAVEANSGNIRFNTISAQDVTVKTTSGNIKGNSISSDSFKVKANSGNIYIQEIKGDGEVRATSGNIKVVDLTGSGKVAASSGNVTIEHFYITDDSLVEASSGNVKVGSIPCFVRASSSSGNVKFPDYYNDGSLLEVKTRSGNIKVTAIQE